MCKNKAVKSNKKNHIVYKMLHNIITKIMNEDVA